MHFLCIIYLHGAKAGGQRAHCSQCWPDLMYITRCQGLNGLECIEQRCQA